ncbi:hypothetical protein ACN4EG_20905 [Alkalinema pantanalense CENA528]|uniref:hypothetical protein n=1 Tax=Alkalinema pantanalense TaxID=1620705 RepID=UPI003D6E2A47
MDFYLIRVLFPAVLIDLALTVGVFWKRRFLQRGKKIGVALLPALLYLLAALVWIVILDNGDPRFQGQGVIGLFFLFSLGLVFTVLRLLLGVILLISFRRR